ncbi:MAG: sugar phosphate isomerase [Lentisphaeria bacterium]|nr:sugar phosphate isomerase [Lentisphaeria bacterium]
MSIQSDKKAMDFIANEKQFHLGFLPTEQSSPLTRNLDREFAKSSLDGVRNLQAVDRNVLAMARRIFASGQFKKLVNDGVATIKNGGRVVFSGCGATGRLSILLECMWRRCCALDPQAAPYADRVFSIMTGGDYALVRSVEFFEDYQSFGRRQVADLNLCAQDMLVAITEGGETSSVLGTVFESLERGLKVFLMFNNPAELLVEHLERSRKAIVDPRVCVLDLCCGPMALAGSTRMQATTSEQLVAGGALECMMNTLLGNKSTDYVSQFEHLLEQLESDDACKAIAAYIDFEADVYRRKGLLTYFSGEYLLDVFTDTTERSPTFMLPPFRKKDDAVSPRSWTFVKNPCLTTEKVWSQGMRRPLRCLEWHLEDYIALGASENGRNNPPKIKKAELLKFEVGKENPEDRAATGHDAAVLVTTGNPEDASYRAAFQAMEAPFETRRELSIGGRKEADWHIPCEQENGPLHLMTHMAVKLVLNTISTGVMVSLGRVTGNWMSWVDVSNKKLIDRAIRLISEIGRINYETSAKKLFSAIEELDGKRKPSDEKVSYVQYVLDQLKINSKA